MDRRAAAPGDAPGHHRRSSRRAPDAEKSLLQDAGVVGKVFWASSIGREPRRGHHLAPRARAQGIRPPAAPSSLDGESEFAFAHALVRDVSYGQIPRADRAKRHRAVAEWIGGLGRPEDHAEMLAYHWSSALELVLASGGRTTSWSSARDARFVRLAIARSR